MVMSRGAITGLATGICLALSFPSAAATSREQTEEIFGEILAVADDKLSVLINDSEEPDVKLGEKFSFQFAGGRDGYLTVLYIDAHGNAVLLFPTGTPDDARVEPGKTLTYPLASAGHELVAVHPVGLETIFAVATPRPISSADLGMKASPIGIPVAEHDKVPTIARQLASLVGQMPKGTVSAALSHHRVMDPGRMTRGMSSDTIVEYLTNERTRSIKRPMIDLDIKFSMGSSELTRQAKEALDEVGKALIHPKLLRSNFTLIGHTDSVGPNSVNMALSKQRAEVARNDLIGKFELSEKRGAFDGRGEEEPLIPADLGYPENYTWAQNRRVTLQLTR